MGGGGQRGHAVPHRGGPGAPQRSPLTLGDGVDVLQGALGRLEGGEGHELHHVVELADGEDALLHLRGAPVRPGGATGARGKGPLPAVGSTWGPALLPAPERPLPGRTGPSPTPDTGPIRSPSSTGAAHRPSRAGPTRFSRRHRTAPLSPRQHRTPGPAPRPVSRYLRQLQPDLLRLPHGEQRVPGRVLEQHVQQHLHRHRSPGHRRGQAAGPAPGPPRAPRPCIGLRGAPSPRGHIPGPAQAAARPDAGGCARPDPARPTLTILPPLPPPTRSGGTPPGSPPLPSSANQRQRLSALHQSAQAALDGTAHSQSGRP